MESGQTALFSEVDPTFAQDTLQQSPFSLCCFGHIHKPQRVGFGKPVYYSGALMQLNFNDEGQERGVWFHDIEVLKFSPGLFSWRAGRFRRLC